ncbi:hypothetical protein WT80_05815 [Burkholderia stagnalis]|nr:hypothetical protein WT80_05815 [Burkholderia stagnalis]
MDRGLRAAVRVRVIVCCASLEALERLLLRLLAQERDDVVLEEHPSSADASADDVALLGQFHRRGSVDLQEIGALL